MGHHNFGDKIFPLPLQYGDSCFFSKYVMGLTVFKWSAYGGLPSSQRVALLTGFKLLRTTIHYALWLYGMWHVACGISFSFFFFFF